MVQGEVEQGEVELSEVGQGGIELKKKVRWNRTGLIEMVWGLGMERPACNYAGQDGAGGAGAKRCEERQCSRESDGAGLGGPGRGVVLC